MSCFIQRFFFSMTHGSGIIYMVQMSTRILTSLSLGMVMLVVGCSASQDTSITIRDMGSPTSTALPVTTARITKVTDGDTFWATFDSGHIEKVRILGVDTPETYRSNTLGEYEGITSAECLDDWGSRATEFARDTLYDEMVQVVPDPFGDERDRFDRLLAYIHVDGKDFSGMLVENGLARVYREYDYSRKSVYLAMEENAQLSKVGLWGCPTSHSGGDDD